MRQHFFGKFIYKQIRVGQHGKLFWIYKFKTINEDGTYTKFGSFFRKTKLDEFPQIVNIIKREMNIVGPRPDEPETFERLGITPEEAFIIFSVKPGLTDFASLEEFSKNENDWRPMTWEHRKQLQIKYVEQRSFKTNIILILKTARLFIWTLITTTLQSIFAKQ